MKSLQRYDIILVTPLESSGAQDYFHLGLLQLASFLKTRGFSVCFFDRNALVYGHDLSVGQADRMLLETVRSSAPVIVGFSCYTSYFSDVRRCCDLIKSNGVEAVCIAGGVHPTFEPSRTLQQMHSLDLVAVGPGEYPLLKLLEGVSWADIDGLAFRADQEVIVNPRGRIPSEAPPIPEYDFVDARFYWHSGLHMFNGLRLSSLATLVTSTPCPGKCRFCIGNKSKCQHFIHDEDRILAEMELLVDKYGVAGFWLADRDFVFDRERATRFARKKSSSPVFRLPWATTSRVNQLDRELASALFESRCIALCLGIESGSQRMLDYLGKDTTVEQNVEALEILDQQKILGMGSFILGIPTQTEADIRMNLDFFHRVTLHDSAVLMLMPVVGSAVYDELVDAGAIDPDEVSTWDEITGFDAHMNPKRNYSAVPHERFQELYHRQAVEIYETCKKNRQRLIKAYGYEKFFSS